MAMHLKKALPGWHDDDPIAFVILIALNLLVFALIFMWRPDSNAYFQECARAKAWRGGDDTPTQHPH